MSNVKNETMDFSTVCEMFEEVKELQAKQLKAIEEMRSKSVPTSETVAALAPALAPEDGKRIETLAEKLDGVSEKLGRPLRHHHTLDFMGNRALIALASAIGALLVSLCINHNQRDTIARNRDNDLKYRYIQMHGEATPGDILRLRNVFDFSRNPDSIRIIRQQVERYEHLIHQQAENEARAKLNDEQAKQLRDDAEKLRRK